MTPSQTSISAFWFLANPEHGGGGNQEPLQLRKELPFFDRAVWFGCCCERLCVGNRHHHEPSANSLFVYPRKAIRLKPSGNSGIVQRGDDVDSSRSIRPSPRHAMVADYEPPG